MVWRRSHLARILAFCQRAFGFHRRYRPFQNLSERSVRYLDRLNESRSSIRFEIAIQQLRYDWDLTTEEATRDDDALRLQLRVLELAGTHPDAERLLRPRLEESPLGRLFAAILAQGKEDSVGKITLLFPAGPDETIRVMRRTSKGESEAMTIPAALDEGLRDFLRLVVAAGYGKVKDYLCNGRGLPDDVAFAWTGQDRLTMTLR